MFRNQSLLIAAVAASALIAGSTQAALVNGDFQSPNFTASEQKNTTPNGWDDDTTYVPSPASVSGYGLRDNGPLGTGGTVVGTRDQYFYMVASRFGKTKELYQDTGIVLEEGKIYTLLVDIGEQNNQPAGEQARIKLYGSALGRTTALAELDNIDVGTNGVDTWATFQTSFTATAGQAGQTLGVALGFATNADDATTINTSFDNVTINVVPEPSSLALLGLGGLLIARRRRG